MPESGRRKLLLERRALLEERDGRPYAVAAPEHVHGRAVGYNCWSCRCGPCTKWQSDRVKAAKRTYAENAEIIAATRPSPDVITVSVPMTLVEFDQIRQLGAELGLSIADSLRTSALLRCQGQRRTRTEVRTTPNLAKPEAPVEAPVEAPTEKPSVVVREPPPMNPNVRNLITTTAEMEAVTRAYYEPDWSAPSHVSGRERRVYGRNEIIVAADGAIISWVVGREIATGKSEVIETPPSSIPKMRGGGTGRTGFTSSSDLIAALERNGCEVVRTGSGHLKVSKDGKSVILPMTPSDHRSTLNSVRDVKKAGLLS